MQQRSWIVWVVIALLFVWSKQLFAQADRGEWDVGRVYIPTENQESFIPNDFWPIELRELNDKLAQHEAQVLQQRVNPLILDRAVYLASINRDLIVSENSYWKFSGYHSGSQIRVGNVSFALRDAKGNLADQRQLSSVHRFDVDGTIDLETTSIEAPFWFGFQAAPTIEDSRRIFDFDLPRAKLAVMLISAESGLQLSSNQVVVEPVANPRPYLGENWPLAIEPRLQPRQTWWVAHIAGVDKFTIEISEGLTDRGQVYQHALSSVAITHQVSPDSVSSTATFQLATESKGVPFQIRLAANQRVRALLIDGKPGSWKAVSTEPASDDSTASSSAVTPPRTSDRNPNDQTQHLIQLNSTSIGKSSKIEVQTVSQASPTRSSEAADFVKLPLPIIELVNSLTISGSTMVSLDDTLEVVEFLSAHPFNPSNANDANSTSNRWLSQWSRHAASSTLILKNRAERWSANSFVRLDPQATSISAKVNMVVTGSNLRSNELRLPVLPGWNVERVRLPLDVSGKTRTGLVSTDQGEQIVLTWTGKPESFEVYLEVTANRIVQGRPSSITIENPRVVQAPHSGSPTCFVIADGANFRLRTSPTLFPMVIAKRDLTSWQQQLIREQDVTVFRDLSGADQKFVCESIPTPASLRVAIVIAEKSPETLDVKSLLNFESSDGGMDHVRFSLPAGQALENWSFELLDNGASRPLVASNLQAGVGGRLRCQIALPQTTAGNFTILASTRQTTADSNNSRTIPVLVTEGCSLIESTLILQDKLAPLAASSTLNFQPSTNCCSPEIVEKLGKVFQTYSSDNANWLSSPISIADPSYISLSSQPKQATSWSWREQIQHEILASGISRHEIEIDIQANHGDVIGFTAPKGWTLVASTLDSDNLALEPSQSEDLSLKQWTLRWPTTNRGVLRCIFQQQDDPMGWLSSRQIEKPKLSIPVLASSEIISIPSGFANLTLSTLINSDTTALDTFLPTKLWNVLSPESSISLFGANKSSWSMNVDDDQRQIWLVNKSSFSTGCLMLFTMFGVAAWYFIRKTVRGWWIAMLAALATVILLRGNIAFFAQIALLALLVGALARLIEVVMTKPRNPLKRSPLSASRLMAMLIVAITFNCSYSQSTSNDTTDRAENKRVYGVIIPFEASTENPGEYAYIPKELRDLLAGLNQTNVSRSPDPKFIAASYVLKLRQDPRDPTPWQEFEAELKLSVPDTNGQLLLPFDLNVLRPISLTLNGQARLLGVRIFEEAEDGGGIIFRPDAAGNVTVNIKFQPAMKDSTDRKFRFVTDLPAIPNATLRIVPNSLTTGLTTNASGGLLRSLSGDFVAQLGPIDELDVQWAEGDRNTTSFVSEYVSETWVRGQSDGFSVAAQVTLDRGRSSQEEFDLIVDSDWEPVGSAWGDAQLVSSNVVTALKRRVIRVRLSESAGATCSFRMLLAQRQPTRSNSIDVPFVSVDRMSLKSRVFWWSSDLKSAWIPEGIESLPTRVARDDWAELRLASERSGYQVLVSGIKLKQTANSSASLMHSEATSLRIFSSHSELEMDATWDKPIAIDNDLNIVLPRQATLKRIESNGRALPSLVGSQGRVQLSPSMLGSNATRIKVVAELPPFQGTVTHLPKIQIENLQPRLSSYAIIRGSDLKVNFLPTDSGLVFSSTVGRRVNFENLESFVGEASLPTEILGESKLAAPIEVLPAVPSQHRAFTMNVERIGATFRATVRCSWSTDQSLVDYAIFEIPATLRDQITVTPFSALFKPNRDESKSTLCIPVPPASAGSSRFVEFSFPVMSATTSQSLTLPNISAKHNSPDTPVIILPVELDGKAIQWQTNGGMVEATWFTSTGLERQKQSEYMKFPDGPAKLNWQYVDAEKSQSSINWTLLDLTSVASKRVAGIVTYGIAPRNQTSQAFHLPDNCQMLGVDCGARQTTWAREGSQVRVTLPTSSAPTIVRLIVQWQFDETKQITIVPPKPLGATLPSDVHLRMQPGIRWAPLNHDVDEPENEDRAIVSLWAEMVLESISISKSSGNTKSISAIESLDPSALQLAPETIVAGTSIRSTVTAYDSNDDGDVSVAELWNRAAGKSWDESALSTKSSLRSAVTHYRIQGLEVELVPQMTTASSNYNRLILVAAIFFAGIAGLYLGPKLRTPLISILANHPWMYWTFIAVAFAFVLPVAWPSWIVAVTAIWMAVSQLLEHRRRTRHFGF